MTDEKDALPSDAENSGLKPATSKDRDETPLPDDKKVEKDPSEQPS